MATTVSTRIEFGIAREIDKLSKEKHMDRATMLRNLIVEGLKGEQQRRIVELYRQDKVSAGKAREMLSIDFDEWLTLMQREQLHGHYDDEMLKSDLKGLSK